MVVMPSEQYCSASFNKKQLARKSTLASKDHWLLLTRDPRRSTERLPLQNGLQTWFVGATARMPDGLRLNRAVTDSPTCRRLPPDFALFPGGYRVQPRHYRSGLTKNREVGRYASLSLRADTWGTTGSLPRVFARPRPTTRLPPPPTKKRRADFAVHMLTVSLIANSRYDYVSTPAAASDLQASRLLSLRLVLNAFAGGGSMPHLSWTNPSPAVFFRDRLGWRLAWVSWKTTPFT